MPNLAPDGSKSITTWAGPLMFLFPLSPPRMHGLSLHDPLPTKVWVFHVFPSDNSEVVWVVTCDWLHLMILQRNPTKTNVTKTWIFNLAIWPINTLLPTKCRSLLRLSLIGDRGGRMKVRGLLGSLLVLEATCKQHWRCWNISPLDRVCTVQAVSQSALSLQWSHGVYFWNCFPRDWWVQYRGMLMAWIGRKMKRQNRTAIGTALLLRCSWWVWNPVSPQLASIEIWMTPIVDSGMNHGNLSGLVGLYDNDTMEVWQKCVFLVKLPLTNSSSANQQLFMMMLPIEIWV